MELLEAFQIFFGRHHELLRRPLKNRVVERHFLHLYFGNSLARGIHSRPVLWGQSGRLAVDDMYYPVRRRRAIILFGDDGAIYRQNLPRNEKTPDIYHQRKQQRGL